MMVYVRLKGKDGLAAFDYDTDDHTEAIEAVQQAVGNTAASPVLALIFGKPQAAPPTAA